MFSRWIARPSFSFVGRATSQTSIAATRTMSQPELLRRVVGVLESSKIPYMATGSVVSSYHGEPRSSHDIDLVVQINPSHASLLVREFPPPDFYLDEFAIREAISTKDGSSI